MKTQELFTARYLALDARIGREVVPVRVSHGPPVAALPYEVREVARSLVPGELMLCEWTHLATSLLDRLDFLGTERVGAELAEISARHGGRPLALLDHGDLTRGVRAPRIVFAYWWEEQTGEPVPELVGDGREVHHTGVHKQAGFARPKPQVSAEDDRRFARSEHVAPWPLSHEDVEKWIATRYWQYARTAPRNPHSYTHRRWGSHDMFLRVCEHVREQGEQEVFGRSEYTYYRAAGRKLWTMMDVLESTIILNCKFDDPEEQARLAEEQTGKAREELGLEIARPPAGDGETRRRPGSLRLQQPKLLTWKGEQEL